jgi:enoyl-CoA hydratase/carnithine racemase
MDEVWLSEAVTLRMAARHVALVTIQRAESRNAVNIAVTEGLAKAVESLESDGDVWSIVLNGAGGKAFCAGADLKEIAAGKGKSLATELGGFAGFVHYKREKLWIAAVEGFALGGGFEIVLACDLVVASQGSVFGLPEPTRGLLAAAGGPYRLPRLLPRNVALELIATGGTLSAVRAHGFGMVNRMVPDGSAVDGAIELATIVCANAPIAVRESLRLARASADMDDDTLRKMTAEAQLRIIKSEDFKEGPRAFFEKRTPQWIGR